MDEKYKGKIFDRLLEIKFNIDVSAIPDPTEINQKIGECHAYIEEVEHFSIRVQKELSVMQKALNNSTAEFELKKDTLLTQEPIKSLPNIKDREAQANLLLRSDREKVQNYQNELNDLNNLLKAITLKIRNLTRANADIRLQLRVLEAQVKLGSGHATSAAAKGLMEEMGRSMANSDSFKEALAEESTDDIADPSIPVNVEDIFSEEKEEKKDESLDENLIDPVPDISPDENTEDEDLPVEEWSIDKEKVFEIEKGVMTDTENGVDLDEVIDIEKKGGKIDSQKGDEKETEKISKNLKNEVVNQKEDHPKIKIDDDSGIDIDDLLNNYS